MKAHWIRAALLGAALTTACGGSQPPQNLNEAQAPPADTASAPAPPASPEVDNAPAPAPAPSSRPSASNRAPAAPRSPAVAPAPAPARTEAPSAAPAAPRVEYREIKVPAGTALPLELQTALSSQTATVEMPVKARLKQAISVDGYTVLPAGTQFTGTVTEVAQAGRVKGRARVTLAFTDATVAGAREKLRTDPITFEAEATRGEDATKIGAGAGIGAAIGGILGGGSGAAKGAAIGGAAGTGAVLATKGKDVDVAEGADIAATLAEPFALRVRAQ